jgi:flagellar biosynthetic protein FlhB
MAEENEKDEDQKTEEPSQRKLDQAREKGQVPTSKEISSWFFVLMSCVLILFVLPYTARSLNNVMARFIAVPDQMLIGEYPFKRLATQLVSNIAPIVAIPLLMMFATIVAVAIAQVGSSISLETLKPKMNRLSPKQGLKKVFSKKAVIEFLKTVFKTCVLFITSFFLFRSHADEIKQWIGITMRQTMDVFNSLLLKLFLMMLVILFFVGLADYLYQRYQHVKGLRMTKQEVKDEHKDIDGDPAIKQRIRRLRMERARNRMMQEVPNATVVITNPTHYSIALKWDPDTMNAPSVIAKGQDFIALKIREVAKENNVPIVENPPVARALFSAVEIDEEIPAEYYKAVADIIKLVSKFKEQTF